MRYLMLIVLLAFLAGCDQNSSDTETLAGLDGMSPEERFYALGELAKRSFNAGNVPQARKHAEELAKAAPQYVGNWNYGNAIQDSNIVLGRIAVLEGRIADAKRHLLEAGKSPGSPQMDTFGPNMTLAKDLIEKGEKATVIEYFGLCKEFWEHERGRLDIWAAQVASGNTPDFGQNLYY